MKNIALLLLCMSIAACGSVASPQLINGKYYMGGDENCRRYSTKHPSITDNEIVCANKDGVPTGKRYPMTENDMRMYQMQQAQARQQSRELGNAFDDLNYSIQSTNSQFRYPTPQQSVAPRLYTPQRINVNCNSVGSYTYCR